jgi:cation diffusion facilitator family transporter
MKMRWIAYFCLMNSALHHERRTRLVVYLTAFTMVIELVFGVITGSMLLLADGIHMLSHTGALGLSWIAYVMVRKYAEDPCFPHGSGKILDLSGYTSGLLLLVFAGVIVYQSVSRLIHPVAIHYTEAIVVASAGLLVNLVSAFLLHPHDEGDHNIRAAYLHVMADALTSVTAVAGLLAAMVWNLGYIDAIGGIASSVIITVWSLGLLRKTGFSLIGYSNKKN